MFNLRFLLQDSQLNCFDTSSIEPIGLIARDLIS